MIDRSEDLVSELIEGLDPGAMVTKFVVVAEGIDTDGVRALYTATHEGAKAWDSIGLLTYALARENAQILREKMEQ